MDRTHLRFFTHKSALELMNSSGWEVDMWRHSPFDSGSKGQILNALTLGLFRDFLRFNTSFDLFRKNDRHLHHDARIAQMTFASIYPMYVTKVLKKGRTEAELRTVISWLTATTKLWIAQR